MALTRPLRLRLRLEFSLSTEKSNTARRFPRTVSQRLQVKTASLFGPRTRLNKIPNSPSVTSGVRHRLLPALGCLPLTKSRLRISRPLLKASVEVRVSPLYQRFDFFPASNWRVS